MSNDASGWVLAVDGGGSGSRFALSTPNGRIETAGGPANIATDFANALANVRAGLKALAEKAGISESDLEQTPAYLGLAGVLDAADARRVLTALPLARAIVESDQPATVEGALGGRAGAVAGLGTGSFFGLSDGQSIKLAGGWGHRIDDRASGYWLGKRALRHALEVHDGRSRTSALSHAIFSEFPTPAAIVAHMGAAGPDAIAKLSHHVVASTEAEDWAARTLVAEAADHILESLRAMGWTPELPLCLIGGVADIYRDALGQTARLIDPAGTALDGAVALARRSHAA